MKVKYDILNQRSEVLASGLDADEALAIRGMKLVEEREKVAQKAKRDVNRDFFYVFRSGESFARGNRPVDVGRLKKSAVAL